MAPSALRRWLFWVVLALAGSSVDCLAKPRVHAAGLPTAPFAEYRTFSVEANEATPPSYGSGPRTNEVRARMGELIKAELRDKGYALADGPKGDFVVAFSMGRKNRSVPHAGGTRGDWLQEDEERDFVEGALVIDIYDGKNDGQVWHGAAQTEIDPDHVNPELMQRAVRDVLASYPRAAGSAK
ncbi:MAG: DUF4136 domain-containing protein [Polyangiaceae bacterium]